MLLIVIGQQTDRKRLIWALLPRSPFCTP
uniref:Uncharacterized protein n=1 Tax=Anguilla anguilla TaxID=7936 RepID=A0A0E9QRY0_ANGAN